MKSEIIKEYNKMAKRNTLTLGKIYDKLSLKFKTVSRDKIKLIVKEYNAPK